jgi:hypothetical protein
MKYILIILFVTMVLVIGDAIAQFKPAQEQYLSKENLAQNGGFEQGTRGFVNASGVFAVDNTKNVIGKNGGCVTLTAQTLDLSQTITTGYNTNLQGLQGVASAYVWSSTPNVQMCALIDGAEQTCLSVKNASRFDHYSIPTVLGSSSIGWKIKTSANETGVVCVDDVSFGAKELTQEIAQSEIYGKVVFPFTTNCLWSVAKTTSFINMPIDTDCNAPNVSGSVKYDGDKSLHFVLPQGAPVGNYKIRTQGTLVYDFNTNNYCTFRFSDGVDSTNTQALYAQSADLYASSHIFDLEITESPSSDKKFYLQAKSSANVAGSCQALANFDDFNIVIEYIPPKSTIIAQKKELVLVKVSGQKDYATGVNSRTDFDTIIYDNYDLTSANANQITIKKSGKYEFNSMTNCGACSSTYQTYIYVNGVEKTECREQTTNNNTTIASNSSCLLDLAIGDLVDQRVEQNSGVTRTVTSYFTMREWEGSPTIVGKFKDINTTDTYDMDASGSVCGAITSNVTPLKFTEISETSGQNYWNGDTFTPDRDMRIHIEGNYQLSSSASVTLKWFEGSTEIKHFGSSANRNNPHFSGVVDVTAGQSYTFRIGVNETQTTSPISNWVRIREVPTTKSIIKNLNDESFFKEKCQIKILSADITSDVTIADLTFSNLDITKLYEIKGCFQRLISVDGGSSIQIQDSTTFMTIRMNPPSASTSTQVTQCFESFKHKPDQSTLNFVSNGFATTERLEGNGTTNETWVEVCEQPESVIETGEF